MPNATPHNNSNWLLLRPHLPTLALIILTGFWLLLPLPPAQAATWTICIQTSSTDSSGVLYDSGGTGANYGNNQNCGFVITPSGGAGSITLSFSAFNLENNFDYLRIYDGTDTSGTLLATLTGASLPGDVTATSGSMYLAFQSNASTTAAGFAASWSSNIGPVNTVPGAQTTNEDTSKIFSTANGNQIAINDADAGSNPVEVILSVTNGTLTLNGTTGLTFTSGDGTVDATMTLRGTVANINTALNGLSYAPTLNYSSGAILTLNTVDSTLLSVNIDSALKGRYHFDNTGD
jgi:hypothetical protein